MHSEYDSCALPLLFAEKALFGLIIEKLYNRALVILILYTQTERGFTVNFS